MNILEAERVTPSFYSKRLVPGCKHLNTIELWPSFYAAVARYIKTRPVMVQEWLMTQPFLHDFYDNLHALSHSNPVEVSYAKYVLGLCACSIKNKDVRDFVYLTSNHHYVQAAKILKVDGLFKDLTTTDLWLGAIAYDSMYFGYLFRDNDPVDVHYTIKCDRPVVDFDQMPSKRAAAKAMVAMIKGKHPFIYGLNACAQGVRGSIEDLQLGGGARLDSVFIEPDFAVMGSVTEFIANSK